MKTIWFSHLPKNEQEDFKAYVRNSVSLLNRLEEICKQKIDSANNKKLDKNQYDLPNWDNKQADFIGYVRAYSEILELINLEDNHV